MDRAVAYIQNGRSDLMTYLLEKRPNEDSTDEKLEAMAPGSEDVKIEIECQALDAN